MSGKKQQEAYRDREGHLWLTADEPGAEPGAEPKVFCYDDQAARRMGQKWPSMPLSDADAEFGPLLALEAVAAPEDDVVLFLAGGGRSLPVPPDWAERRWDWRGLPFQPMIPGYQVLLLGQGEFRLPDGTSSGGAYIVIRRVK